MVLHIFIGLVRDRDIQRQTPRQTFGLALGAACNYLDRACSIAEAALAAQLLRELRVQHPHGEQSIHGQKKTRSTPATRR